MCNPVVGITASFVGPWPLAKDQTIYFRWMLGACSLNYTYITVIGSPDDPMTRSPDHPILYNLTTSYRVLHRWKVTMVMDSCQPSALSYQENHTLRGLCDN